jgi:hypothetical protein
MSRNLVLQLDGFFGTTQSTFDDTRAASLKWKVSSSTHVQLEFESPVTDVAAAREENGAITVG